ncbi:hypothetical protein HBH98_103980 [Parastagonospora nodorum]|nr:hypothetical protein HBH53_070930 [Parastagonospora nodorum]KAH3974099.1 hypothetical protein HBH52_140880 [Parastagonospora nodorum]KAH3998482.1 hypothetical protein HBI10_127830 [Parastagonospora nodorum]KAH4023995.1 hypothetical protein HBI13_081710 [Parastagonospora nodorum]KAH4033720.1 hypothetical protein HBI09_112030 [Parastagonospora nodorum]
MSCTSALFFRVTLHDTVDVVKMKFVVFALLPRGSNVDGGQTSHWPVSLQQAAATLGSALVLLPPATPNFTFSFLSTSVYIQAFENQVSIFKVLPAHSTASGKRIGTDRTSQTLVRNA